jgi:hypothetical protein
MKLRQSATTSNAADSLFPGQPPGCSRCCLTQDADAEWRSFCVVLADAVECAIDLAILHVADDPDDVAALEHLRAIALARLAGSPTEMRVSELLQAVAIFLDVLVDKRHESRAVHCLATPLRRLRDVAKEAVRAEKDVESSSSCKPPQATRRRGSTLRAQKNSRSRRSLRSVEG